MRPFSVFRMTAAFAWRKCVLCLMLLLAATGLFCLMVVLTMPVSKILGWLMLVLWLAICVPAGILFYTRVLYAEQAGHIAAVMRCITTGGTAAQWTVYDAKRTARRRFPSNKHFFAIRRHIKRSILQLQRYFERVTDDVGDVAGMKTLLALGKFLEHTMLAYLVDGCTGYILWCDDLGMYMAAKESVAVYAYNWNRLTEHSGEAAAITIGSTVIASAAGAYGMSVAFEALKFGGYSYFGAFLGIMLVLILKYAFLDSYLSIRAIKELLDNAQETVLSEQLYTKLSGTSKAFAKLHTMSLAHPGQPTKQKKAAIPAVVKPPASHALSQKPLADKHESGRMVGLRLCPSCGLKNPPDATVCPSCGASLN